MPRVELWLGDEKRVIRVLEEEMSDYIRIHGPLEPLCAHPPEPFDHRKETVEVLHYRIEEGWRDDISGEMRYRAVQIE